MSDWLGELWRRLQLLFNRQQFEHDLDDEMRLHRQLREQEYRNFGIDQDTARYKAQRQFGSDTLLKEVSREIFQRTNGRRSTDDLVRESKLALSVRPVSSAGRRIQPQTAD